MVHNAVLKSGHYLSLMCSMQVIETVAAYLNMLRANDAAAISEQVIEEIQALRENEFNYGDEVLSLSLSLSLSPESLLLSSPLHSLASPLSITLVHLYLPSPSSSSALAVCRRSPRRTWTTCHRRCSCSRPSTGCAARSCSSRRLQWCAGGRCRASRCSPRAA